MGGDEFSLSSGLLGRRGFGLVDLGSITLQNPFPDPTNEGIETEASRPVIASQTRGPHRYTVVIPNQGENSVLNVGQAAVHRINNTGITGRTESHVHWHTTRGGGATMVALGWAVDALESAGLHGIDGDTLAENWGFQALTKAHIWLEANKQWYGVSETHDVTLRTLGPSRRAVIQADDGELDLIAKKNLYAVSQGISIIAPTVVTPVTAVKYADDWTGSQPKADSAKGAKNVMTVIGAATSAHDIVRKFKKTYKKYKDGKLKPGEEIYADAPKWLVDVAKFALTVPKIIEMFTGSEPKPGCVKINADADVGILAGGDVSAFGTMGFSAGSAIWTSLSAGVSTSIKSTLFAGVGGAYTSLKGYRKIEMASDYGKASIKAAKDVEIASEDGALTAGAKKDVQLTSSTAAAYIGAKTKTHIGCAAGGGTGLTFGAQGFMIGLASDADDLKAMKVKPEQSLHLKKDSTFEMRFKDSKLRFHGDSCRLESGSIDMKAKNANVTVNGSKILLG